MISQTYSVGHSTISITFDDIAKSGAEILVSSDDTCLSMGGGVSEAIKNAAGAAWAARVHKVASREAPARIGEVVVTAGDPLPAKYVLHAITLDWEDPLRFKADKLTQDAIARQCTRKVMELLPLLRCRSVALPAIGTGVAGIDPECAASEMDITSPPVDPKSTAVFLSSTFDDLKSYRQKAKEKVLELGFQFIGMEHFPSWPQQPSEFIKSMVERAHVYFGILGMRYGFVDSTTGLSMTELEYRRALAHGKPIHMFLMDNGAIITAAMVETDPENMKAQQAVSSLLIKTEGSVDT